MSQNNFLMQAPPFPVEDAVSAFGRNLRTARVRRNITIAEAARRIGAGVRAVRDAEYGKVSTSIAVYFALMWLYDMLPAPYLIADPDTDQEGKRLAGLREPKRASSGKGIDNDF